MRNLDQTIGSLVDKRFFRGVMLSGTMEVLADTTTKEMIWQEYESK